MWVVSGWFSVAALAQDTNPNGAPILGVGGEISQSVCNLAPLWGSFERPWVVNLPALQTTVLLQAPFTPVVQVPLGMGLNNTDMACLIKVMGSTGYPIEFDPSFASVVPRSGLLRNIASTRPAQNVLVQLGLIGSNGLFTPLDLTQPQVLNVSMLSPNPSTGTPLGLNLGLRYVAERFVSQAYASAGNWLPGSSDVTAGNVSVFLPFVVNLK